MKEKILKFFDASAAIFEHRMFGLCLWMWFMFTQDLLKDVWVQSVLNEPNTIKNVPLGAWFFVALKASIPTIGAVITYKSNTWALKSNGKQNNETPTLDPTLAGSSAGK